MWTSLVFLQYFKISLCYGELYMQIIILLSTLPRLVALKVVYYLSMLPGHNNQMPRHQATRILLYFIDLIFYKQSWKFQITSRCRRKNETGILSKCSFFNFPARLSNMHNWKASQLFHWKFPFSKLCEMSSVLSFLQFSIIQGNGKTLFNWFVRFLRKNYANYVQNKFL